MTNLLTALAVLAAVFALYAAYEMHVVITTLEQWDVEEAENTDLVDRVTQLATICLTQNQTLQVAEQALGAASMEITRLRALCAEHGIDAAVQS